jgi:hypothetical protein
MAPFDPRDNATQRRGRSEAVQEALESPGEIAFVREYRVLDAAVLREQAELQVVDPISIPNAFSVMVLHHPHVLEEVCFARQT